MERKWRNGKEMEEWKGNGGNKDCWIVGMMEYPIKALSLFIKIITIQHYLF